MDKFNPWVRTKERLGNCQAGTFVYSKVGPDGISAKHIVDDVTVNEPLAPPPDAENAVLAGGVNIEVQLDTNYKAAVVDGNRLRTCEIVIRTLVSPLTNGTYGVGAVRPSTSPSASGTNPKA